MLLTGYPETSVTINIRSVTSQKSEDLGLHPSTVFKIGHGGTITHITIILVAAHEGQVLMQGSAEYVDNAGCCKDIGVTCFLSLKFV